MSWSILRPAANMHGESFLHDLAVVMMVAGAVTLLFHRLKQPVVLGYLLAGFIIGPHAFSNPLVEDTNTIETLANMGVIFLMFSLGLDFHLRKLRRVGPASLLIASIEISVMMVAGFLLGSLFGWSGPDSFFLGVMLSLTSTMIVIKGLKDKGEIHERHAELISGTCLFEDIYVILVMVLMPGFARTGSVPTLELVLTLTGLFVFLVVAVILGLLLIPRLLRFIARHATEETMLIVSLGLLFGLSLFAVKLHFSEALGAFLVGAIVAESRDAGKVTLLTEPIRDMFCAVFFVAIGMQINPAFLGDSIVPALLITVVFILVKTGACSMGSFLSGADSNTSMRVGTNMAQLGEFAFILAALATQLDLISERIYPLIVSVAAMNALIRPYLVGNAERLRHGVVRAVPDPLVHLLSFFRRRAARLDQEPPRRSAMKHVWSLAIQIVVTMALIAGGFAAAGYIDRRFPNLFSFLPVAGEQSHALVWLTAVVLLLPLFIAVVRKMQAMAMMLSELMVRGPEGRSRRSLRSGVYGLVFGIELFVLAVMTLLESVAILPTWQTLLIMLVVIGLLVYANGRAFNRWYTGAKFALLSTFNEPDPAPEPERAMPPQLKHALLESVILEPGTHGGQLIRELQLRTQTGASIVALEREGQPVVNPGPDVELQVGDRLLLLGDKQQLADAVRLLKAEPGTPASGPS